MRKSTRIVKRIFALLLVSAAGCALNITFFVTYTFNKEIIFEILSKILKSKSAKKFFYDNYESKCNKDNQTIKYHFDRDDMINEIKSRIEFYPLFDTEEKANTNPIDLTIIVNSIPGKFVLQDEIN